METKSEEDEGDDEDKDRDGNTSRGATVDIICGGGGRAPSGENVDLPDFTPEHAHLLLQGVYGDFLHHNNWFHLDGGVANDAIW